MKYILATLCCLPFTIWAQHKGFNITGKVGSLNTPAMAYLSYTDDGKKVQDSVVLQNGVFVFKGQVSSPAGAELILKHDTLPKPRFARTDYLFFYIENANISITAADSVYKAVVKGSVTNDDDKRLKALQRPYKKSADSLVAVYNSLSPEKRKDSAFTVPAKIIMSATQAGYDSVNRAFIAMHPHSYISLITFQQLELAYNFNPDTAAARFARFPADLRESATGRKLAGIIEKGKQTNNGAVAINFVQNDTTGKPVQLADFKGQYVLLDFWASWCAPCRAENPNLLAAYKKYKDKNFTILGVSLDDEQGRSAWLNAVKKDGLPWTQVSELKGFNSKAAVLYGVSAIPSNFLIDPAGKIIARNLRGEDLEKKLSELFVK